MNLPQAQRGPAQIAPADNAFPLPPLWDPSELIKAYGKLAVLAKGPTSLRTVAHAHTGKCSRFCITESVLALQVKPEDIRLETLKDEAGNDIPHVLGSGAHGKARLPDIA